MSGSQYLGWSACFPNNYSPKNITRLMLYKGFNCFVAHVVTDVANANFDSLCTLGTTPDYICFCYTYIVFSFLGTCNWTLDSL